jgi:hypothetical protein
MRVNEQWRGVERGLGWNTGRFLLILAAALALTGCSRKYYRNSADQEVAKAITQKTPLVPNMDTKFTIEQSTNRVLEGFPVVAQTNDYFGAEADIELGANILSLEQALELAIKHSRTYQNRKEQLFLEALDLTLARHRYTPIFSAGAHATYLAQAADVQKEIETIIGTEVVRQQKVVVEQQHTISGGGDLGMSWFLATGGKLAAAFSTDFVRFMTGDPRWATGSRLSATLTQPLLRGAGFKVALENLTQAERNLLYGLRDFTRFRKDFSVQVASLYYQVLQGRDEVRNAWIGLQNFRQNVERERAFVEVARTAETSLGRLQQAELSTEGQWVDAVRSYRESLDLLKILLGLPVDTRLVPDEKELQKLSIVHPNIAIEDAVRVALETRLDLYNQRDQFEDSARKIEVAADGLKPDLDLILQGNVASKPGLRPQALDFEHAQWSAGLDMDLPLDRKAERIRVIHNWSSGTEVQPLAPELKRLEAWVGTWDAEVSMMGQMSKGSEVCRIECGGNWLVTEHTGSFMGQPLTASATDVKESDGVSRWRWALADFPHIIVPKVLVALVCFG